jgi:hypothetical protein
MGGTHGVSGGTGKAEDAKLPDAGIRPEAVPRRTSGRKRVANWTQSESREGQEQESQARAEKNRKSHAASGE